jgi:hypothetical protein
MKAANELEGGVSKTVVASSEAGPSGAGATSGPGAAAGGGEDAVLQR